MSIFKDLIYIIIFLLSLCFLYSSVNNLAAVVSILAVSVIFYKKYCKLEEKLKNQKSDFTEILTHDLKTPILAQLRGLELIQNRAGVDFEQKELLDYITDSCKFMLHMISMVIETYRFDSGEKKCYFEEFNVAELLSECFDNISSKAIEKNIELIYEHKSENLIIEADRQDLKTVLINLLSNAIDNSYRNEKIIVKLETGSKFVKIAINNNNPKAATKMKTLFSCGTKYTTIGNNIALYLCKKIIDNHKGYIYTSKSNFMFVLPRIQIKSDFQTKLSV